MMGNINCLIGNINRIMGIILGNACILYTPCLNGGTCYENAENNGFHCVCPDGFSGYVCETGTIDPPPLLPPSPHPTI